MLTEMKSPRGPRSRRRALVVASIVAWVVITTTYVVVVAVTEGAGSAIVPAMAAIGGDFAMARLWVLERART